MRRRDDYAIGKESVRGEREVERERSERGRGEWRSRDYSAVYSNGQSDPHQSQRAAPPIPLSNATGEHTQAVVCTVRKRVCGCVCVCVYLRIRRCLLSHVESRNGNMQLGRQASLRRLENSKDLPGDPSGCELVARHRKDPGAAPLLCPFVITAAASLRSPIERCG